MVDRIAKIIKYLKFTVASSGKNDYGDLIVTSKYGCDYKISNKRSALFDIFQPETAVIVGYSTYMNKDYIAVAHLADQFPACTTFELETPPVKPQPTPVSQATESKSSPTPTPALSEVAKEVNKLSDRDEERLRSVSIAYSKDLAVAKVIELAQITTYANKFLAYIKGSTEK